MPSTNREESTATRENPSLLVVEDELDQQELLRCNLQREGFAVHCADDGEKGLDMARKHKPDLIVLDLMLPGVNGIEVARALRSDPKTKRIPIVMVTAKSEDTDVLSGFETGADDYVAKPYSPKVLMARIKAVLRRKNANASPEPGVAPVGGIGAEAEETITLRDITIRPERFDATLAGKPLQLSGTEFRLLTLLARHPGRVFTREQIIRAIHGENCAVTDRSVDVHVFWLRQKLGPRGRLIEAVRGVGYRMRN